MTSRQKILIVGGELSGVMAAAYLACHLPKTRFDITYSHTGKLVNSSWYSSTHADIRRFNRALKISEAEFVQKTKASFKLGELYIGWGTEPYINSFTDYGSAIGGVGFMHLMQQQERLKSLSELADFTLPVKAALAGKFSPPDAKGRPIVSDYDYGYHIDPASYADLLLEKAINFGANLVHDTPKIKDFDFIVNASGRPLGKQNPPTLSWAYYGFGKSYTSRSVKPQNTKLSLTTTISTNENGWTATSPTQCRDEIVDIFFDSKTGENSYECGCLKAPWIENVVNIGAAALTVEPILGAPLRMAQYDLERLLALFPANFTMFTESQEYNRRARSTYDRLRDYLILQYKTNKAKGQFWDLRQNMTVTDIAKYKLDLFRARGRIAVLDDDHLFRGNWVSMLLGQGERPRRYDYMANVLEQAEIDHQLSTLSKIVNKAVDNMPSHEEFILMNCAAKGFAYAR